MRLLARILVLIAAGIAMPDRSEAQTPPYGYWQGWSNAPCPNNQGSPYISECPSPKVACESFAAFRGGTLSGMTPRFYANGELIGFTCSIANGTTDSEQSGLTCPNSSIGYMRSFAGCLPEVVLDSRAFEPSCGAERGNGATGGSTFGNPTIVANGARLERVTDFTIGGEPALTFTRFYYGQAVGAGLMGVGWASDLDRALGLSAAGANPSSVTVQWPTGRRIAFTRKGSSPNYTYGGDDDTEERLTQTTAGWELRDRDDRVESYDKSGRLLSIRWRNGYQQRLVRDEDRVLALVDSFQRTLRFVYQGDLLASVTDPSGRFYRYDYEDPSTFEPKRLSKVIYPDATPADPNDNPSVRYLYEDTRFPYALTGMVDEKGDRFATWQYDAEMRVVASEHAGGVDRFTAGYDRANRITTVTNPLGKETRHHFALVEGKWKPTRVEGRPSANCAAADQLLSYNSKGFVASRTDWNGNVTNYVNDSRGLPTSITEAVGTPLARTRTVTWHPSLRLPTQIVAPRLSTSLAYDGDGNLLSRTETDTTSHSLPYATNGQQRTWTLTYADAGPALGTPTAAVTLTLVNPAAESGSLTGWTSELGAFTTATSSPSPAEGTRYFTAGSVAESLMRQDVALPGTVTAQADAGLGLVRLAWKQRNYSDTTDLGAASLIFLDAAGLPLGTAYEGKQVALATWTERSLELQVPPGARTVRVKLHGVRLAGTKNDAHFDDLRLSYEPLFTIRPRLLASIDGPRTDVADTTGFAYDATGNLTGVTNPLGQVTQVTAHDARGLPLTVLDPNGVQSTLAYDERGRLLSVTADSGAGGSAAGTGFTYDAVGQVTRVTLPDGSYLDYSWDAAHRLTQVANGLGERIAYTRDAMGNVTQTDVKSAGGTIVRTQGAAFDELGRLLRDIGAATQITAYGYDKNDNLTSVTDPLSHASLLAYDALDRLVRETDALTGETDLGWDTRDGFASLADPRDVTTSFVRNGFGEPIQETSPDRGTTVYVRDAAGNVTQRSDGRGVVANASFDALDRQLALAFPATPTLNRSFGYDATAGGNKGIGRLTSLADAQGSASFGYDARGNLLSEARVIGGQSYTTGYGWDLADNLVSLTYPSGRIVEYARDGLGRVTGVTTRANAAASPVTLASGITYRPFGPIAGMSLGNGLSVAFAYDGDGRLTGIATTPGIQGLTLGYDTASRLTGIADALTPGRSQTLGYDVLDRLTSATGGYGSLSYGWDAGGNRTSRAWTQGGTTTTDSVTNAGTSNRLLGVARGGQSRSLGYDGAGNVTSDTRFDGTVFAYGYDGDGRLATLTRNALPEATYGYDAFQRRVLKTAGGTTRHFLHDPDGHLLAEATAAGATTTEWLWLGGTPLAMVADADTASPRLFWFHTDQLGTPQKLTDSAGNLAWDAVLEPFGELASLTVNLVAQPLRLRGQYADPETGLHQNWHRDYDPSLGRYLQPDPLGIAAGNNLYGYAHGNPATYSDPDGQNAATIGFETGFAIGGPPGAVIGALAGTAATLCALNPTCRRAIANSCEAVSARTMRLFNMDTALGHPPFRGTPGTRVRGVGPDGTPLQDRTYGTDGYPERDVDYTHDHGQGQPHVHDWDRPSDGTPPTHRNRKRGRPPNPGEVE